MRGFVNAVMIDNHIRVGKEMRDVFRTARNAEFARVLRRSCFSAAFAVPWRSTLSIARRAMRARRPSPSQPALKADNIGFTNIFHTMSPPGSGQMHEFFGKARRVIAEVPGRVPIEDKNRP
jgi:hypothetical protein